MMVTAPIPFNEAARLSCLTALDVLDTEAEPIFEQITQLAATLCKTPISLISLVDTNRQWFKSNHGLPGVAETPRKLAFCAHAILSDQTMEVCDATQDARFATNPLVTGQPGIRFYAGTPLTMAGGERLGTLCVIDLVPRQLTIDQRIALEGLAKVVATTIYERKQRLTLSNELAQAEDRYRLIVEGQSELISVSELDGTLAYVNQAYARFFGTTADALTGRNLLEFVAEPDRAQVHLHLQRVSAAGAVITDTNRLVSADGKEHWVAWSNRCIPSKAGRAPWIHSVGRDITEQRRAEQALAASELHSRMMYEATPALLHSIDPQGRLMNVTETWLRHMGYAKEEVIGRPSTDFLTPESAARARDDILPSFFALGRVDNVAYQMVRRDGTVIDVLLSAVLERDDAGNPMRSLAVLRDITEWKAAAASLSDTSHMLQLVLDGLPARVSYWGTDHRNRFANKAFCDYFGLSQEKVVGQLVNDVLGEIAYAQIKQPIAAGLSGIFGQIEATSPRPDGLTVTTDMRFIPDLREGEVRGLFVFALDITAQRQAERKSAEGERRFKLLVDGIPDYAIYMLDPQGCVATWNMGAARHTGYQSEEVLGKSFGMFFPPEETSVGRPQQALALARRDGRYEAEGWRVRADGSRFWAGVLLSPLRNDEGDLVGYAKITRDLTDKRRQEAMLERVVELAPCAMLMVNADSKIIMANAQSESTFGYTRAELISLPIDRLLPGVPLAQTPNSHVGLRFVHPAHATARLPTLYGLRSNGKRFPIEIGVSPIDSSAGHAMLAAVFDVSERHRQQAATEQALAEKETLLKEVYHRVKNNLQVVQSLLSLQYHGLSDEAARAALQDSVQRVRAMALVHEKLYQSGNLSLISLQIYTKDLLDQIAEAHGVARRNIVLHSNVENIQTRLDTAIPYGLLLTELVTNALKHAFVDGRHGNVYVDLARDASGDVLTVADDGIGLHSSASKGISSSMGLQLADSLAGQLGGKLNPLSSPGTAYAVRLTKL